MIYINKCMITCEFCNREFSNVGGRGSHVPYCKVNPNRTQRPKSPNAHAKKGKIPWNKGITKHDDKRLAMCGEKLSLRYQNGELIATGRASTPEKELLRIEKITTKAKLNNGGYRQGSGRGKKGWYKGFFCDSSWELAYVIYCLEHNIDIKRNTEKRTYTYKDRIKNYIPDFIVEGEIIEIKGYKSEEWLAKLSANPDVKVLYEKDLQPILDYVIMRYSKKFIELYE